MGKITVACYISLDGVMENPHWTTPYWDEQLSDYQDVAQKEASHLLLGRKTFEAFAAVWPDSRDEGAPFMNAIPKLVPTTTLKTEHWNARFISQDVLSLISAMRQQHALLVYGSAELARFLFAHELVDEYREMVFPLLVGEGKRLFAGGRRAYRFSKLDSVKTSRNVLLNTYSR